MDYSRRGIERRRKELHAKMPKLTNMLGAGFYMAAIIVLVAAVLAGSFAAAGVFRGILVSAPDISSIDVRPTGYSSSVYDSDGNQITKLVATNSNRIYQTIDKIPIDMQHAFVAMEDERFYEHNGIDIKGIARAAYIMVATRDMSQGASTITQQLIKNSVFDKWATGESTFEKVKRKIQEQYLAIQLERQPGMTKDSILELYLNTINLGQNTLGVQAASLRYFGKNASDLNLSEASVIAAITSNPSRYNPISHPDNNAVRRQMVLDKMLEQGYITNQAYQQAVEDDPYERIQTVNSQTEQNSINSYFVDAMVEEIMEDFQEKLGYTENQAYNMLYSGGLQIFTTQDSKIQKICDDTTSDPDLYPAKTEYLLDYRVTGVDKDNNVQNFSSQMMEVYFKDQGRNGYDRLYASEEDAKADTEVYKEYIESQGYSVEAETMSITPQPQISLSIEDQSTGYVKAIIGGRGKKEASLTLNRATDTVRQPGSTFKIVSTYAPAFDLGAKTLGTVTVDEPFNYANGRPVSNWYSSGYKGPVTLRYAIEQSMNIIAVKTLTDITPQVGFDYLLKFGFTTLVDNEVQSDGSIMSDVQQALALGGITHGVKNYELNAAYATIANRGVYHKPIFYTKILDHDGNVLLDNTGDPGTQVIGEAAAFLCTSAMEDVVTKGTGAAVNFGTQKIAGKTGTTTGENDLWFAGYTPYYTCTTWTGYDNNKKMYDKEQQRLAKTVWRAVMEAVHENLPEKDFPAQPPDVTTATVCNKTGKLASDFDRGVGTAHTEFYRVDTIPSEVCNGVHMGTSYGYFCAATGQAASETCPFRTAGTPIVAGWCPHSLDGDGQQRTDAVPSGTTTGDVAASVSGNSAAVGGEENGDIVTMDPNLIAALLAQQAAQTAEAQ
ncbi:MAG: transglycosylase domain-containing protein [Lachnospiraceae bacterium]|nr:transglycosylase domain-containing protein [Lachnospiraceae bacterium]